MVSTSRTGKTEIIVATNGCFDILHVGHVRYLKQAKSLGTTLIVGLNSDISVKQIKGKSRPVNKEQDRLEIISCLYFVDKVIIFSGITAHSFLEEVKPDIYVKGGDYSLETLPEKDIIEKLGIKAVFLPFHEGHSTTSIINKLY